MAGLSGSLSRASLPCWGVNGMVCCQSMDRAIMIMRVCERVISVWPHFPVRRKVPVQSAIPAARKLGLRNPDSFVKTMRCRQHPFLAAVATTENLRRSFHEEAHCIECLGRSLYDELVGTAAGQEQTSQPSRNRRGHVC